MSRFTTKGFTLIELLIVVAIVGILAAIAIPNFLQAQVRAKVARVQADMKTLTLALHTYSVDNNDFPPDNYMVWLRTGVFLTLRESLNILTTPIDYISSVPLDPFFETGPGLVDGYYTKGSEASYVYEGTGREYTELCPACSCACAYNNDGYNWMLSSYGPSRNRSNPAGVHFGACTIVCAGPGAVYGRQVYDPTNGTISYGMIIYTSKGWYNEQL